MFFYLDDQNTFPLSMGRPPLLIMHYITPHDITSHQNVCNIQISSSLNKKYNKMSPLEGHLSHVSLPKYPAFLRISIHN